MACDTTLSYGRAVTDCLVLNEFVFREQPVDKTYQIHSKQPRRDQYDLTLMIVGRSPRLPHKQKTKQRKISYPKLVN